VQRIFVFLAVVTVVASSMVSARTPPVAAAADPVIAIAGDVACEPADPDYNGGIGQNGRCEQRATSDLLLSRPFDAVLTVGDNQYEDGTLAKFNAAYDPTWGRVKRITRPSVGNHEYETPGAAGYYGYFGAAAGDPSRGYYSYDIGAWHLIALNSVCDAVGGCGPGSPQEQWLAADLAANAKRCTLAYWHHPRFSSGAGNDPSTDAFWQDLYRGGADLVVDGHHHIYERFAPQTPGAVADPGRGIRQFTVGTGGEEHHGLSGVAPNSEVRDSSTFGVLQLGLHPTGYDFSFLPVAGGTFTDAGSGQCHYAPDAPAAPKAVTGDGSATVTWSPPSDAGVPGLTSYRVTASPGGATVTTSAGTTTASFSGLANATSYTFTVAASNVVGTSPPSPPSNAVTPIAPPRPPDAPAGVSAHPGDRSATVSWSAPRDNGSPITGYTVTASPGGARVTTTGTSATIAGLHNRTSYTVTVTATNAVGTSHPSAPSNPVVPAKKKRKG